MAIGPGNSGFIADVAAGASGISEIYAGSNLVWEKTPDYGKWDWADPFNGSTVNPRWWTNADLSNIVDGVVNTPGLYGFTMWTTQDVFSGGNLDAEITIGSDNVSAEYTSFMVGDPQNHFEITMGSNGERAIWEIRNGQPGTWIASTGTRQYKAGDVVGLTRRGGNHVTVWFNHQQIGSGYTNAGVGWGRIGLMFRSRLGFPVPIGPGVDHVGIMDM